MSPSWFSSPSLAEAENAARSLYDAYTLNDAKAIERITRNFPRRQPTLAERNSTVHGESWTLEACRLVVAREASCSSWSALARGRLAAHSIPITQFIHAVFQGDPAGLRTVLDQHYQVLRPHLDAPFFHFDAPAVVQLKHDRAMLEVLLNAGADINARSHWWAGGFGVVDDVDEAQARWLIDRGARLDVASAAGLGWREELAALCDEDPESVHRLLGDGKRALHWAKDVETARLLLERGAEIDARDLDHGSTAAQHLLQSGTDVPRFLVEQGASCDLFMAAALGDIQRTSRLIADSPESIRHRVGREPYRGLDDDWGGHIYQWSLGFDLSPHEVAHRRGHHEVYRLLMEASERDTRLVAACLCSDDSELARLRSAGYAGRDAVEALSTEDQKLMATAAWNGNAGAVRRFLDIGFDPHLPGAEDSTPLDRAAFRGWAEVVQLLLERDQAPPLERRNRFGGTPLSACLHGATMDRGCRVDDYVRTASALLDAGSEIDSGGTPTGIQAIDELVERTLSHRSNPLL